MINHGRGFGLTLFSEGDGLGVFAGKAKSRGPADLIFIERGLRIGDGLRFLKVDGLNVYKKSKREVLRAMRRAEDDVTVTFVFDPEGYASLYASGADIPPPANGSGSRYEAEDPPDRLLAKIDQVISSEPQKLKRGGMNSSVYGGFGEADPEPAVVSYDSTDTFRGFDDQSVLNKAAVHADVGDHSSLVEEYSVGAVTSIGDPTNNKIINTNIQVIYSLLLLFLPMCLAP